MDWSPVQGVLATVYMIKKLKKRSRSKGLWSHRERNKTAWKPIKRRMAELKQRLDEMLRKANLFAQSYKVKWNTDMQKKWNALIFKQWSLWYPRAACVAFAVSSSLLSSVPSIWAFLSFLYLSSAILATPRCSLFHCAGVCQQFIRGIAATVPRISSLLTRQNLQFTSKEQGKFCRCHNRLNC
jgi:hypothetical protein